MLFFFFFFFSSRRRHTRFDCDWSSDVCSSDLNSIIQVFFRRKERHSRCEVRTLWDRRCCKQGIWIYGKYCIEQLTSLVAASDVSAPPCRQKIQPTRLMCIQLSPPRNAGRAGSTILTTVHVGWR